MALVLIATAGAANANSYATRVEGDAYHEGRLHNETWEDASTVEKEAALVWATRILENRISWDGWAVTSTQALQWPRAGMMTRNGYAWASTLTIPQEIKDATIELARSLLTSDTTATSTDAAANIKELKAGPVDITFRDNVVTTVAKVVPDAVLALIPYWWIVGGGIDMGFRELVRA